METVQTAFWVVALLVALALMFDFMNGFHDAANSIATVVSTGVLKPAQAVLFAAFFNFVAIFIFHLSVAATVGKGIVQPGIVDTHVVFGALVGAILGFGGLLIWQQAERNADGTVMFAMSFEPSLFVMALVLATVTGLFASFAPALRAARLDPVVAILG